ncbi:MAG: pyridoxal phosphate-dependent aminotransferase [Candidatus Methanomethylophilaceae archaeon]|nr:pyridoxal phosphate-dependent aminotransferase [Candidatus Methanomethylophilaceae archaeon]MBR2347803.1 pyridoxal phosphate-dependent aminotransferase [Candidatus Methanomethylophilaceae archaeon]
MVSKRLQEIPASGTIAISNLVSQMKSEGIDIVSFSMGEPDFTTPANVIDACCDSLRSGNTHYTPSMGIPALRKAVADVTRETNGVPCQASNVLITPCKQAIFLTALAYIDPGDEVILADPSWVSYEACIRLAGGVPVYIPTKFEEKFVIDPALIEAAITPRTKMIILNTPSNPTGGIIPRDVLKQIADIAIRNGIKVMSDEIYESIIYEGKHTSIASFPGMFENTIIVSGLSKSHAMTGWRLGWAIAPEEDIKAINKLQSHSISCAVSFVQDASVEAITGPQDARDAMVAEFRKRRDLALDLISEIPGIQCNVPDGAFYIFPKYDADLPSAKLAEILLKEGHVAVTPGSAFGPSGEGFFRLSYATSEEQIREGISRIKKVMSQL